MNNEKKNDPIAQRFDHTVSGLTKMSQSRLPTVYGEFIIVIYRDAATGIDHPVLVRNQNITSTSQNVSFSDVDVSDGVLVRLHSECLTGDVFGSQRCDCGPQLHLAMQMISEEKKGVIIYLRGHEGRGIGLANKISAYTLQDRGHDTASANRALNLPVDARSYNVAANILRSLNLFNVRLMTNNPGKIQALDAAGLKNIKRVELKTKPNKENYFYLQTKKVKMGHLYDLDRET